MMRGCAREYVITSVAMVSVGWGIMNGATRKYEKERHNYVQKTNRVTVRQHTTGLGEGTRENILQDGGK